MKFYKFYLFILAFASSGAYAAASNWVQPVTTAPTNPLLITDKVLFEAYQDLATQINSKGPSVEEDVAALDSRVDRADSAISDLTASVNGKDCDSNGQNCARPGLVQNLAATDSAVNDLDDALTTLDGTVNGVGCDGDRCATNGLVQNLAATNNNLSTLETTVNGSGRCTSIDNCANPSIVMNVMKLLKDAGVISGVTISNGTVTGVTTSQQSTDR